MSKHDPTNEITTQRLLQEFNVLNSKINGHSLKLNSIENKIDELISILRKII